MNILAVVAVLLAGILPGAGDGLRAVREEPDRWNDPRERDDPELDVPYTAADLAADCNADGALSLTRNLEVRWGSGALTRDCKVALADEVGLELHVVTLTGPHDLDIQGGVGSRLALYESRLSMGRLINFEAGDHARLELRDSALSTLPGGTIHLSPGGDGAVTEIRDSSMTSGGDLLIAASIFGDRGSLTLHDSALSSGTGPLDGIVVYASLSGTEGEVQVTGCIFNGSERIEIVTGELGRTAVTHNTFNTTGPVEIAAGEHGECVSSDNVPHADCARQ